VSKEVGIILATATVGVGLWILVLQWVLHTKTIALRKELIARKKADTEVRRSAQVITLKNAELEGKNSNLNRLIDDKDQLMELVAHDLKNPLNTITLAAQLLADFSEDQDTKRHARVISDAAHRAVEIVCDVLEIHRFESGNMEVDFQHLDLAEILAATQAAFYEQASNKGIDLVISIRDLPQNVYSDALYIRNILDNLVSNAIKFTPPGPPEHKVTMRLDKMAGGYCIEVEDEGPGFTEEDKVRMFHRFTKLSAAPTRGENSTGLGLSIVKRLVGSLGGRIQLESELGHGALFRIVLPNRTPESLKKPADPLR
jgi:signal transduction histidine kinase